MDEKKIEISIEEYNELMKDSLVLQALELGGVYDWEWYSDSLEDYLDYELYGSFDK